MWESFFTKNINTYTIDRRYRICHLYMNEQLSTNVRQLHLDAIITALNRIVSRDTQYNIVYSELETVTNNGQSRELCSSAPNPRPGALITTRRCKRRNNLTFAVNGLFYMFVLWWGELFMGGNRNGWSYKSDILVQRMPKCELYASVFLERVCLYKKRCLSVDGAGMNVNWLARRTHGITARDERKTKCLQDA